jgi:hypothetical protein
MGKDPLVGLTRRRARSLPGGDEVYQTATEQGSESEGRDAAEAGTRLDAPAASRHWTPAQQRMAAALVDIGNKQGRATGERWTLVAAPLAELNERSGRGRNCGTVYAHVRALRHAGAVRRPVAQTGLLLDLPALADIAQHATHSAGPSLPTAGRSQLREGNGPRTGLPGPDPSSCPGSQPTEISEVLGVVRQVLGLLERIVERNPSTHRHELDDIHQQVERLADAADHPRDPSRAIRDAADRPRDTDRREGGRVLTEDPVQRLPPSLEEPDARRDVRDEIVSRTPRNVADPPADTTGPVGERDAEETLTDQDLDDLVSPLVQIAAQAGLVGMTNIADTRAAIRPYSTTQIRHAVAMTAAMARTGKVKSPIGWLVAKARHGDPNFFPEQPPAAAARPEPPVAQALDPLDIDAEAEAAVTALEADPDCHRDALDQLDQHILATLGPATAKRVTGNQTSLHTARVSFWRRSHPSSPAKEP